MERKLTAGKRPEKPQTELAFRISMAVEEMVLYRSGDTYPLCPRCHIPLNREYQSFCDRCGQKLDWAGYDHALIVARF